MAKLTINVGTNQDDGTGDLLRAAFVKVNDNFTELYDEFGGTSLSNLKFAGNTISTDNTNANLILNPNGTGKLQIEGSSLTTGDATVNGSVTVGSNLLVTGTSTLTGNTTTAGTLGVTGATTLSSTLAVTGASTFTGTVNTTGLLNATGSVDLGDTSADTVTFTGRIDSSIVPSVTNVNNFGSASLRWANVYATNFDASGNITVSGNITLGGNITVGDADTDSITINADLTSHLMPNADSTYNIGSNTVRWASIFADTVTTAIVNAGNIAIQSNTISSADTDGNINLTPNGTGEVVASTLQVTDLTGGNRVVYAATSGALTTSSTLTFDGTTLALTGAMTLDNLTIDGNTISTTSGDIILSPSSGTVSTNTKRITQVGEPTTSTDAATKNYVDTTAGMHEFSVAVDDSTASIISNGETLQIKGSGVFTTLASDTITIAATLATVTAGGATTTTATSFNGGLTANTFTVDSIRINDNNITTNTTNTNLTLIPNGTGVVEVRSALSVTGDITGTLATAAQPNITSLGTLTTLTVAQVQLDGSDIRTTVTNADLHLKPSGSGDIVNDGHVALGLQSGDPAANAELGYIYAKTDTNTEVHVMDGVGNVTKISPHNNSGEWEYFSRNVNTGKVVRVNMERMIRKLEEITGEQFIEEE